MKRKFMFLSSFLCLFVLVLPMVSAPVTPPVMDFGPLPFRSINVDGDPGDWGGIPPLILDPPMSEEPGVDYVLEDIAAVYGANDENFLYFLMELHPLNGTIWIGPCYGEYRFYIDIRDGGDSNNNSADFFVSFYFQYYGFQLQSSEVRGDLNGYFEGVELHEWNGFNWVYRGDCLGVMGNRTQIFIEVGVPWNCIGGPECFNCFFKAHFEYIENQVNASDYAPNQDGQYVMVGCCPTIPEREPVGGEITSSNILLLTAQILVLALSALSGGVLIFHKKKHNH
jgi:hypothetical protein